MEPGVSVPEAIAMVNEEEDVPAEILEFVGMNTQKEAGGRQRVSANRLVLTFVLPNGNNIMPARPENLIVKFTQDNCGAWKGKQHFESWQ